MHTEIYGITGGCDEEIIARGRNRCGVDTTKGAASAPLWITCCVSSDLQVMFCTGENGKTRSSAMCNGLLACNEDPALLSVRCSNFQYATELGLLSHKCVLWSDFSNDSSAVVLPSAASLLPWSASVLNTDRRLKKDSKSALEEEAAKKSTAASMELVHNVARQLPTCVLLVRFGVLKLPYLLVLHPYVAVVGPGYANVAVTYRARLERVSESVGAVLVSPSGGEVFALSRSFSLRSGSKNCVALACYHAFLGPVSMTCNSSNEDININRSSSSKTLKQRQEREVAMHGEPLLESAAEDPTLGLVQIQIHLAKSSASSESLSHRLSSSIIWGMCRSPSSCFAHDAEGGSVTSDGHHTWELVFVTANFKGYCFACSRGQEFAVTAAHACFSSIERCALGSARSQKKGSSSRHGHGDTTVAMIRSSSLPPSYQCVLQQPFDVRWPHSRHCGDVIAGHVSNHQGHHGLTVRASREIVPITAQLCHSLRLSPSCLHQCGRHHGKTDKIAVLCSSDNGCVLLCARKSGRAGRKGVQLFLSSLTAKDGALAVLGKDSVSHIVPLYLPESSECSTVNDAAFLPSRLHSIGGFLLLCSTGTGVLQLWLAPLSGGPCLFLLSTGSVPTSKGECGSKATILYPPLLQSVTPCCDALFSRLSLETGTLYKVSLSYCLNFSSYFVETATVIIPPLGAWLRSCVVDSIIPGGPCMLASTSYSALPLCVRNFVHMHLLCASFAEAEPGVGVVPVLLDYLLGDLNSHTSQRGDANAEDELLSCVVAVFAGFCTAASSLRWTESSGISSRVGSKRHYASLGEFRCFSTCIDAFVETIEALALRGALTCLLACMSHFAATLSTREAPSPNSSTNAKERDSMTASKTPPWHVQLWPLFDTAYIILCHQHIDATHLLPHCSPEMKEIQVSNKSWQALPQSETSITPKSDPRVTANSTGDTNAIAKMALLVSGPVGALEVLHNKHKDPTQYCESASLAELTCAFDVLNKRLHSIVPFHNENGIGR